MHFNMGRVIDLVAAGKRLREARERSPMGNTALDIKAEVGIGTSSRFERGERLGISLLVVAKMAHTLGINMDWLLYGIGDMRAAHGPPPPPDLPVSGLLLKMRKMPGLEKWIEDTGGVLKGREPLRLSTLARGVHAWDERRLNSRTREDQAPLGGWGTFFADVEAGAGPELPGGAEGGGKIAKRQAGRRPKIKR